MSLPQSGKHIASSCTVDGQTLGPLDVLIADVRAILATLTAAPAADLAVGYVANEK